MIERHYDEEALIALMESKRAESDAHLQSCSGCAGKLESFQMIAEALQDRDVWDAREVRTEAVPATIATLRGFADRMAEEDTAAESLLTELLAGERETWLPRLAEHPEWRTAGVVRKLIEAASRAIDTMPPDAVEMTVLATNIAEALDPAAFAFDTIPRLRGAAWRERAYALYYTGRFLEAEGAVGVAEGWFGKCGIAEYDSARLGIVRALVLRAFERFAEAERAAAKSADAFTPFGDNERLVSARIAEVHLLFSRDQYARAAAILSDIDRRLHGTLDGNTYARVLANLGYSYRKLGRLDDAIYYYRFAADLLETAGVVTEVIRVRWNVAATLAEAGRTGDALAQLEAVMPEMERLGMTSEVAVNALELSELLLAYEEYDKVEQLCQSAIQIFRRAGVPYTTRAQTALAYVQEAVNQRRVTKALVRDVKNYIRRLPAHPNLLFAPAPPS